MKIRDDYVITWRTIVVIAVLLTIIFFADPRPATFLAGAVLVGLSCLLRIWSFGHLDKNLHMVTTGPYAHSRNPAYLGSLGIVLGLTLAAGNFESPQGIALYVLGGLLVIAFFGFYLPRKFKREYGRLQQLFGDAVDEHAANVPDFWPRITPWRSGDDRKFSLTRVSSNNEWGWPVLMAAALVGIWFIRYWSPVYLLDLLS